MVQWLMIDAHLSRLFQIASARGYTRQGLALAAGLSRRTLKDAPIDRPGRDDFNPTTETIRAIERVLLSPSEPTPRWSLGWGSVLDKEFRDFGASINEKIYLKRPSAHMIDDQISRISAYLDHYVDLAGRLDFDKISYKIISSLGPECAVHVVEAHAPAEACKFVRWHRLADYRGGVDMTGAGIMESEDRALNECFAQDHEKILVNAEPQYTLIRRRYVSEDRAQKRSFLRLMRLGSGRDDAPQILIVRGALQGEGPGLDLLRDFFGRRPDEGHRGLSANRGVEARR
jgi:hypothetical protein